jgi:FkbM family methyltransferase
MFTNLFKRKNFNPEMHPVDKNILTVITGLSGNQVKSIVDAGAHHGRFASAALGFWPGVKLYCFEPSPEAFENLKRNLDGLNCELFNCALAGKPGISEFFLNKNSETNSLLKSISTNSAVDAETSNMSTITVEVKTLDEIFADKLLNKIDLLKIDVQGATLPVLEGAVSLLKQQNIRMIQCEVEFISIYKDEALFNSIWSFLEKFSYELYSLYNLHYDINERLSWADALFICTK